LLKIEYLEETEDVYDIQVEKNHNFYANDILVHNCEILQPTKPLQSFTDEDGEIGICILSAVNLLESKPEEYEEVCDIIVNLLDELISYQNYPFKAAENFCKKRRSLGVGVTNFAAYLASMGLNHESPESIEVMSVLSEQIQYYLLLASAKLAKEFGACEKYSDTLYSEGWLPNQKFNDSQKVSTPVMDWDSLAEMINEYGLRHSTLTAQMPCESSSITQCSTNGIEPIRSFLTVKSANTSPKKVLTPYFPKWKDNYSKVFELKNNDCILKLSSAMQEWFDMSISTNTNLNYEHFSGGSIPLKVVIQDMMKAHKLGVRTLYYNNTPKGNKEKNVDDINTGCESGACSI
jgi:ribonucleoside-diphosphate reductase alpha chain